ncbi:MAG: hypothetical protein RAO94_03470 [Candidatus Stygibacter australis]|nr:hypothetical protein [Candidatus Stygibacter australis]
MSINKLCILGQSEMWENLLIQIGIPYDIFNASDQVSRKTKYSALIFVDIISDEKLQILRKRFGKKVIFIFTSVWGRLKKRLKSEEKLIWSGEEYRFGFQMEIYESEFGVERTRYFFPIKLNDLTVGVSQRRQFYYSRQELPSERVSMINYREITRFVKNFLVDAFKKSGKELLGYGSLPDEKPLFIFRIDTDFAEIGEIKALYEICRKYGISATWFVDVHDNAILEYYKAMQDQEISLHCDKHYVYQDKVNSLENIQVGLNKLLDHKISPAGFAAPFGDWNQALEEVLFESGFTYSSEFSFAWDSLPVMRKQGKQRLLQIPIHPISPGRLRRSHFSQEEMLDYYLKVIDNNVKSNIPAIIYHHPAHGMLNLIEEIFKYLKANNINNLTMHSYASWWSKRCEVLELDSDDELYEFSQLENEFYEYPEDFARIYKKSWRWYLYEYEANKGRRHFKKYGYPAKILAR